MKFICKAVVVLGLMYSNVVANEYTQPIKNVKVYKKEQTPLSVQNLSNKDIAVYIYGETFDLPVNSGLLFSCSKYDNLEIQIKNSVHSSFQVPCSSRVVIGELFTNQNMLGK